MEKKEKTKDIKVLIEELNQIKKQLSEEKQVEGKYTPKYIRVCRKCGAKI